MLKFDPAPRVVWNDVPDAQWNDWHWQMRHRIRDLCQIDRLLDLTPEERSGIRLCGSRLAMSITPYFFELVERDDPEGPIRRQMVPRIDETRTAPWEMTDPCGEDADMVAPGLVHRYPDRVLLLVTDRCAVYCRYCTRSRLVSGSETYDFHPDIDRALDYIRSHPEVRDVLLSGGDPFLLADERISWLLGQLRAIEHVEFLRIGTRIPVVMPQRVTPALCTILRRNAPVFVSIHMNHPKEATREVHDALGRLADAGIPVGNQAVLLRGVNDDPAVMRDLMHRLLAMRARPYYIYQCDLVRGTSHLRTSVARGLEIMESLRGHTTGYAVPQYVIDAPGGGGKVPVGPGYLLHRDRERVVIRNYEGKVFEYPEPADPEPAACTADCCPASCCR